MDAPTMAFAATALQGATGVVLDVGSRNINGCLRTVTPATARYVGIDIAPGRNVDVQCDGAALPFVAVDTVTCVAVFEHTPDGQAMCREAHRVLVPGGRFVAMTVDHRWPPHSAVDGGVLRAGEYYGSVSEETLRSWLCAFEHVETRTTAQGHVFAVAVK